MEKEATEFFDDVIEGLKSKTKDINEAYVDSDMFKKMTKDKLSYWLEEAWGILERFKSSSKDARLALHETKSDLVTAQSSVIKLQSSLLENKTEQLKTVQSAVASTVKATVQTEIRDYSEVVKKASSAILAPENLNAIVKKVSEVEDRSKNVILFGLEETENENISANVCEVFKELNEKPKVVAKRIGKKGGTNTIRPVKVTLTTSGSAHQILKKSSILRTIEKFQKVYICPDRTVEQRAEHKILVLELKNRIIQEPDKHHYIKNGKMFSVYREVAS